MESVTDQTYLAAVAAAPAEVRLAYRTAKCTECGEHPRGDGWVPVRDDYSQGHFLLHGAVIIGCEGYWHVDPNRVGIDSPNWQDWTGTTQMT